MKKFLLSSILLILAFSLAACGNDEKSAAGDDGKEKTTIRLGTSPGPYSELFLEGIKPILEKQGYKVEAVDFTELRQANVALADKGVDLNVDQHTAYMENFNKEYGAELVPLTPIPTVPTAIFPGQKKSLDEIAKGDTVAIPQDPSNAARAYRLLEKAGWIKLKDGIDPLFATKNDIAENPLNLNIIEMDSAQIPRILNDDIAFGVVPGSMAYAAGLDPKTALLPEDVVKQYELVAVVNKEDKDAKWAKAVVEAYKSDEFKAFLEEKNKDEYWFIPEAIR